MQLLYDELVSALSPSLRNLAPEYADFCRATPTCLNKICPAKTLSISLTDNVCEQNCAHCNGHYLKGMHKLTELHNRDLQDYDAVLLSGGSSQAGSVPLTAHLATILNLPEHLKMNLHPGFQPVEPLLPLKTREPVISFDLPANDAVIRDVFKLPYKMIDYQNLFISYNKHFTTVPHICIGLNSCVDASEENTIDFLAGQPVAQTVFIIFRPTPGTELANANPPAPARVIELIRYAKNRLSGELLLGCMRPAGDYRSDIDILAWLQGITKIVQPHRKLLNILEKNGIKIKEFQNCCALNI